MKFLKSDGENLVFQVGKREKGLLLELFRMYPLVPPAHHRISDSPQADSSRQEGCQALLDEALAEHRSESKRQLEAMLQDPARFVECSTGYRLHLTAAQLEWLLQVLNDVRVGSWLLLGSPDEKHGKRISLNLANARYVWAMELSGHIQYILLSAREPGIPPTA